MWGVHLYMDTFWMTLVSVSNRPTVVNIWKDMLEEKDEAKSRYLTSVEGDNLRIGYLSDL